MNCRGQRIATNTDISYPDRQIIVQVGEDRATLPAYPLFGAILARYDPSHG